MKLSYVVLVMIGVLAVVSSVEAVMYPRTLAYSFIMNDTHNDPATNVTASFDWITNVNYSVLKAGQTSAITETFTPDAINSTYQNERSLFIRRGKSDGAGSVAYIQQKALMAGTKLNFTAECWYRWANGSNDTTNVVKAYPIFGQSDGTYGLSVFRNRTLTGTIFYTASLYLKRTVGGQDHALNTSIYYNHPPTGLTNTGLNSTWEHIAFVINAGGDNGGTGLGWMSLIINGSNQSHFNFKEPLTNDNFTFPGTAWYWGITNENYAGQNEMDAYLDECRVWNSSLTAGNITQFMKISIPGVDEMEPEPTLNFSFALYDEDSQARLTNTSPNLTLSVFNTNVTLNFSINPNVSEINLSNLHEGRYEFRFGPIQDTNYLQRTRIFFANSSNTTRQEKLFLVNTTVAPNFVTVTLLDETNNPISNYTIQSQRRFVTDGWLPVEDAITDTEGQATMNFHLNSIPYRFLIRVNNTNILTIDPITVRGNTLTLRINLLDDPLAAFRRLGLSEPQINNRTANESGNLSVIYEDTTHTMDFSWFEVQRFTVADRSRVCLVNSTSNPIWYNCTLPNESGTTFLAKYCIHWPNASGGSLENECYSTEIVMGSRRSWGAIGAVIGVFVITMAFIMGLLAGGVLASLIAVFLSSLALAISHIWVWGYGVSAAFLILIGLVMMWGKT